MPPRIGNYVLGETLGIGSFARSKKAVHCISGTPVALKIFKRDVLQNDRLKRVLFEREVSLLQKMNHPHIAQIYEILYTPKHICLVLEYASGGELFDYIVARNRLTEKEGCRLFRQMLSAIHYAATLGVVHRDLKPENVLLSRNGNIKIIDFGLGRQVSPETTRLTSYCGSPAYAAPEMLRGTPYTPTAPDCWSLGVLLYTLLVGRLPFKGGHDLPVVRESILHGTWARPTHLSPGAMDVLERLLVKDFSDRGTTFEVSRMPWMNKGYQHSALSMGLRELVSHAPSQEDSQNAYDLLCPYGTTREAVKAAARVGLNPLAATFRLMLLRVEMLREGRRLPNLPPLPEEMARLGLTRVPTPVTPRSPRPEVELASGEPAAQKPKNKLVVRYQPEPSTIVVDPREVKTASPEAIPVPQKPEVMEVVSQPAEVPSTPLVEVEVPGGVDVLPSEEGPSALSEEEEDIPSSTDATPMATGSLRHSPTRYEMPHVDVTSQYINIPPSSCGYEQRRPPAAGSVASSNGRLTPQHSGLFSPSLARDNSPVSPVHPEEFLGPQRAVFSMPPERDTASNRRNSDTNSPSASTIPKWADIPSLCTQRRVSVAGGVPSFVPHSVRMCRPPSHMYLESNNTPTETVGGAAASSGPGAAAVALGGSGSDAVPPFRKRQPSRTLLLQRLPGPSTRIATNHSMVTGAAGSPRGRVQRRASPGCGSDGDSEDAVVKLTTRSNAVPPLRPRDITATSPVAGGDGVGRFLPSQVPPWKLVKTPLSLRGGSRGVGASNSRAPRFNLGDGIARGVIPPGAFKGALGADSEGGGVSPHTPSLLSPTSSVHGSDPVKDSWAAFGGGNSVAGGVGGSAFSSRSSIHGHHQPSTPCGRFLPVGEGPTFVFPPVRSGSPSPIPNSTGSGNRHFLPPPRDFGTNAATSGLSQSSLVSVPTGNRSRVASPHSSGMWGGEGSISSLLNTSTSNLASIEDTATVFSNSTMASQSSPKAPLAFDVGSPTSRGRGSRTRGRSGSRSRLISLSGGVSATTSPLQKPRSLASTASTSTLPALDGSGCFGGLPGVSSGASSPSDLIKTRGLRHSVSLSNAHHRLPEVVENPRQGRGSSPTLPSGAKSIIDAFKKCNVQFSRDTSASESVLLRCQATHLGRNIRFVVMAAASSGSVGSGGLSSPEGGVVPEFPGVSIRRVYGDPWMYQTVVSELRASVNNGSFVALSAPPKRKLNRTRSSSLITSSTRSSESSRSPPPSGVPPLRRHPRSIME